MQEGFNISVDEIPHEFVSILHKWKEDWNTFASDVLGVTLDVQQVEILTAIQHGRRISVRSGTARGKDFVAAVAAVCFLYLTPEFDLEKEQFHSTKVVLTAPTGRQIRNIMIPEISKLFNRAKFLPGRMLTTGIRMPDFPEWFLDGFKAQDENVEAWSGLHAPNVMVVVTEASGISQTTMDSIEGVLQGNSRLLIIFNPNRTIGEAYQSTKSPLYTKFKLNCMNAPNVINKIRENNGEITAEEFKELEIPGQVDFEWVDDKFRKPGWVTPIAETDVDPGKFDLKWDGKWFRPGNLFRVKVLGEFPEEGDDLLIPLSWIELSNEKWKAITESGAFDFSNNPKKLGVDVAGMGRDNSCFVHRHANYIHKVELIQNALKKETIHMEVAGRVKNELEKPGTFAFIDTIGEGAGVQSRLAEQGVTNAISVKFSQGAKGLRDLTGEREFANMRAYLYWALRDALNPAHDNTLALPPDDMLTEELADIHWEVQSNGKILIEPKDDIKQRIGRSPDIADGLVNTFYPERFIHQAASEVTDADEAGFF